MKDAVRFAVIIGTLGGVVIGWGAAGLPGAATCVTLLLVLLVLPWWGQPLWVWGFLYAGRNRPMPLTAPVTVANDRSSGGVRYQDGVTIAAIQVLGRAYRPTLFTSAATVQMENTFDLQELVPLMHQSLGLTIDSISVLNCGARRSCAGDYPRVYDSLIGPTPYAGQRETWLVIRMRAMDNGEALRLRSTTGAAALAAAQRVAAAFQCRGIRAKVGTATDIVELERRLGCTAVERGRRRWHSVRSATGWQTTYAYRPADITTEALASAWSLHEDRIIQNLTLFPEGCVTATVTVRSAQQPCTAPSSVLVTLPGEQIAAARGNLCCPRTELRGARRASPPGSVVVPIGPSGVLLGRTATGDRLLLPMGDAGDQTRVNLATDDAIAKRLIIRTVAAGEQITVHSTDLERWSSVRMARLAVTTNPRPAPGTSISVVDGTVSPSPRPSTVISVGLPPTDPTAADVVITQTGPDAIRVAAGGEGHTIRVELFRSENRYMSRQPIEGISELETVEQP